MKRFFRKDTYLLLIVLLLALVAMLARGQNPWVTARPTYDWTKVTTTGQHGPYINQVFPHLTPPSAFTISWSVNGTAPSVCTLRVEGSADGVAWVGLDAVAPAVDSLPCTSSNMRVISQVPVRFVRVNVVSYTAGDSTTSVVFQYTAGN